MIVQIENLELFLIATVHVQYYLLVCNSVHIYY